MLRNVFVAFLLTGCLLTSICAHDLFLKSETYFLQPNAKTVIRLLSGTFQKSDGLVARDRLRDASVMAPDGQITHPASIAWRDEMKTTLLEVQTGVEGTYVVSVSTKPREINLSAASFNDYLRHDGLPDILAERRRTGELRKNVRERYSKHVRTLIQVGNATTDNFKQPLGYTVELIPQQNPYSLAVGDTLDVLCTLEGQPLVNQFVMAGWENARRRGPKPISGRTNALGIVSFKLVSAGKWYVKMIQMTPLKEPGLNYESKWATLTFEMK